MTLTTLLHDWPTFALAAGVVGLASLLLRRRPDAAPPRWLDPAWLALLVLPTYMVHQFEEHGVDLLGRRYHFLTDMCVALGYGGLDGCPADARFIFAVNVGGVWLAGLVAILFRRRAPLVAACAFGIPIVNGVAHVGSALVHGAYNSGVLTSVLLFFPIGALAVRGFARAGVLSPRRRVAAVFASGALTHVVLLAAFEAYVRGVFSGPVMWAAQVANGLTPVIVAAAFGGFTAAEPRPRTNRASPRPPA